MRYLYYPGCSLEGTAAEYDASTRAVLAALGVELVELEDWTCCGASAGEPVSYLLSMVLPARNLALAERIAPEAELVVPCSACYLNLRKVGAHTRADGSLLERINAALGVEDLRISGRTRVRHLIDVLATDLGPEPIREKLVAPLSGLRVVPYYGCQALRPYGGFDDPELPTSMEPLLAAAGAEVQPWSMGAKCCGAGLMTTKSEVALSAVGDLLSAAKGADCIVTVCPMCQMNLESAQKKISRQRGEDLRISVLYLPQLLGLALGLSKDAVKLGLNLAVLPGLNEKLKASGAALES